MIIASGELSGKFQGVKYILIILFIILHIISFKQKNLPEKIASYKPVYWILFLVVIITLILFFNSGNPEDFIYFKF